MPPLYQLLVSLLPLARSPASPLQHPKGDHASASRSYGELDSWIERQKEVAAERAFANIGKDPNYYYTWTRDAALTASGLLSLLPSPSSGTPFPVSPSSGDDPDTRFYSSLSNRTLSFFADYIDAQTKLQHLDNPSGTYEDLEGLGEPKFEADGAAFTGDWGRPQRDGPALRASAVMRFLHHATAQDDLDDRLRAKAVRLVQADLDYTAKFWNHTTFDLWEEVRGSSFFTTVAQVRALSLGAQVFASLDPQKSERYRTAARKVLCFAQEYLENGVEGKWVRSNINVENGVERSGLDANSLLATLLSSPASSSCAAHLFTPCSPTSLTSLSAVLRSFTSLYPINRPRVSRLSRLFTSEQQTTFATPPSFVPAPLRPLAIGRYREDVYYGGNPWYLTTLAAAEQLYRAVIAWEKNGKIVVNGDAKFWGALLERQVSEGSYERRTEGTFEAMVNAAKGFADGLQEDEDSSAELECPDGSEYNGTMSVGFEVEVKTEWGESILLAGSSPSLGRWNLAHAVWLSAAEYTEENPVWNTKQKVEVEGRRGIEYKFVKLEADGTVVWEGGKNRILYTSSDGERVVRAEWNGA
ncbi:glycoside hydrolase 15 protein [Rhodosporidiobolus nylandii]